MTVSNLTFDRNRINGAGTFGIEIQSAGWGNFANVTVSNAASGGLSLAGGFDLRRGAGNSGFQPTDGRRRQELPVRPACPRLSRSARQDQTCSVWVDDADADCAP